jgi:RHS repeat-associated protein
VEYVPFGEVFLEEKNAVWNTPYLFNGKELDKETGMSYYGARYYEAKTSVWLSVDPLALRDEFYSDSDDNNHGVYNSFNLNGYAYCYQSPTVLVDPDGENPIIVLVAILLYSEFTNAPTGNKKIDTKNYKAADRALVSKAVLAGLSKTVLKQAVSEYRSNKKVSVEKLLENATPGRATKGKTTLYEKKEGNYSTAEKEFERLAGLKDVKNIKTEKLEGKTGTLPDGRTATVRTTSSDGRPTLEIRNPENGRGIEIRYGKNPKDE